MFVEKPLALSDDELSAIITAYQNSPGELMVGFNRRFSPLTKDVKEFFSQRQTPLVIQYRVNAGYLPKTHWTHDPVEGGGRILGEVCHFVDLIQYLTDAEPIRVYAEAISSRSQNLINSDNVSITLNFSDGSLGVITYVALGDGALGKERIEVFGSNAAAIVDDFRCAEFYGNSRRVKRVRGKGKGHREEVQEFIEALLAGEPSPISFNSLVLTTLTTLRIHAKSPIVQRNPRGARPAGRVMVLDDRVIRYAQDCLPSYGTQVRAFEVSALTANCYEERIVKDPVLTGSGAGWNASGSHHIDPHKLNSGHWLACVDGFFWGDYVDYPALKPKYQSPNGSTEI